MSPQLHHGCRMHADCPYEYFCGMMVTGSASETDSLCMPCFWCEGCHPNTTVSPEHWFLTPVEPTCGHCPCAEECAPGCSVSMAENQRCDEACFTKACNYDNYRCPFPVTDGEQSLELLPCEGAATQLKDFRERGGGGLSPTYHKAMIRKQEAMNKRREGDQARGKDKGNKGREQGQGEQEEY
ncbi:hypothetical protein CYMTET_49862 [Cymbomonas tetramitiformis]|uniref:Uncharacterized protein n=1 Tax=Cymbomonas tetramitiformis TaxID=36881 RepID=A0AAE0BQI3_9CHLO|nr:hypothetical protein CYMTET_49862 [Cymbomonas tetramitiformis]